MMASFLSHVTADPKKVVWICHKRAIFRPN